MSVFFWFIAFSNLAVLGVDVYHLIRYRQSMFDNSALYVMLP